MKFQVYVAVVMFSILLTGCSQIYLSKPNGTNEQFKKDKAYCEYEALKRTPTTTSSADKYGIELGLARRDIIIKCMEVEKGYTQFSNKEEARKFQESKKD